MRISPIPLTALAVVALLAAQASVVSAASEVADAEVAFVDALRVSAKAEAARKVAEVALEREKAAWTQRTVDIETRRSAALGVLEQRVQEASEALERLRRTPTPVVDAIVAHERELAEARATLKPHLDAAQKNLVVAKSKISVARAAIERAKARIDVAKAEIAEEEARIS